MGMSMEKIEQGALQIGNILSAGMTAWDRVAKSNAAGNGVVAAPQTGTPLVTPSAQTTAAAPAAPRISGTVLVIGAVLALAFFARRS